MKAKHVDIALGIIRKGSPVWAHQGQLSHRVPAIFLEDTGADYNCLLEDGRNMKFKFVRSRVVK